MGGVRPSTSRSRCRSIFSWSLSIVAVEGSSRYVRGGCLHGCRWCCGTYVTSIPAGGCVRSRSGRQVQASIRQRRLDAQLRVDARRGSSQSGGRQCSVDRSVIGHRRCNRRSDRVSAHPVRDSGRLHRNRAHADLCAQLRGSSGAASPGLAIAGDTRTGDSLPRSRPSFAELVERLRASRVVFSHSPSTARCWRPSSIEHIVDPALVVAIASA